jgi:hypothetical protein
MKIKVTLFLGSRISEKDEAGTSLMFHNCFLATFSQMVSTNALPGIGNELDIQIPRSDGGPWGLPKVTEIMQTLDDGVLHHHVEYRQDVVRTYKSTFGEMPNMGSVDTIGKLQDFDKDEWSFLQDRIIPDLIKMGFKLEGTDRSWRPVTNS